MMDSAASMQAAAGRTVPPAVAAKGPMGRASGGAATRYGRWFRGESPVIRKLKPITPGMSAAAIADVTRENLALIGDETANQFARRLPAGHALRKAVRASVLRGAEHLGTCRFGEIVTGYADGRYSMVQVFLANFAGALDTSDPSTFLTPFNREYDQMYFGLHVLVDRAGNALGFNHDRGTQGVAFQTRDMTKALYQVATASTGLSLSELQARAARNIRR